MYEDFNDDNLNIFSMADVKATEVKWLFYPYIPMSKITIIQGDPGQGKTTFILHLAAILSRGGQLPENNKHQEPINIIYQSAEDGLSDTIKPRLDRANANCNRIMVIDDFNTPLFMTDERLMQAIKKTQAKLVILDPLQGYLGSGVDMHRANEIRPIMKHLSVVAEENDCAIVLIGHMNKANGTKSAYRGLGSIDLQAAARSVLVVGRIDDDPQVRIVAQLKSSLASEGKPLAFRLGRENAFEWLGHYDISIDDLLAGGRESKGRIAEKMLIDILSDRQQEQKVILNKANLMHISKRTLDRAKRRLGIISKKEGNKWFWSLP